MSLGTAPPTNFNTNEYGSNIGSARWMAILRATENNPTLKELADELHVMYLLSEEVKQDDDSYEMMFVPTETGVWKGLVLG